MPKVAIYNIAGAQIGEMDLNNYIFGIKPNKIVLHQAVVMQLANQRQGNAATKTRAMVRGGGRKPWRQKGTGRARAGTIRSPLWVGGGTVFGPQPRSYAFTLPRKVRRLAIRSALSAKVNENELIILDNIELESSKTKQIIDILKNLKTINTKTLIVTHEFNKNVNLSTRNISNVKTITFKNINVYDILHHTKIFVTKDAAAKIEEVFI